MNYEHILYSVEGSIARVTLNRPERRNPLSVLTVSEIHHAFARARDDGQVRVVILTGAGKAFSAGGDLSQMGSRAKDGPQVPPCSFVDLNLLMTRMGKPVIAMVNGAARGGGLGLVVACDLALAADTATFGTPEIKVGLWPMMIMATIFRNVGRKQGMRLVLTGERVTAHEAVEMGLINEVFPADELEQHTLQLAGKLAARSPAVIRLGLEAFHSTSDMALEPSLRHLEGQLAAVLGTEDAMEGLAAFMQKRKPMFKGR